MAVETWHQPAVLFPPQPSFLVPTHHAQQQGGWFAPNFAKVSRSKPRRRWSAGSDSNNNGGATGPQQVPQQVEHRKKTKKKGSFIHSSGQRRSVPRAPEHSPSVLLHAPGSVFSYSFSGPGFHAVTPNPFKPGTAWKNGLGTVDKEAADIGKSMGIDMFGSNAGLITSRSSSSDNNGNETAETRDLHMSDAAASAADGSDLEDPFGFELHLGEEGEGPVPASARAQMEEQQAYIAQLEEQGLNLTEKLFIAEQQVRQLRARLASSRHQLASSTSDELKHCSSLPSTSDDDALGLPHGASDDDVHVGSPIGASKEEHSHMSGES